MKVSQRLCCLTRRSRNVVRTSCRTIKTRSDNHVALVQSLSEWGQQNGLNTSKVDIREHPTKGRGLFAKEKIFSGECIFALPSNVIMKLSLIKDRQIYGTSCQALCDSLSLFLDQHPLVIPSAEGGDEMGSMDPKEKLIEEVILSLFLLSERYSPTSLWSTWIQALPPLSALTTALTLNKSQLRILSNSPSLPLFTHPRRSHTAMLRCLTHLKASFPATFGPKLFSEEDLKWAHSILLSRGMHEGGLSLFPIADLVNTGERWAEENVIVTEDSDQHGRAVMLAALQDISAGEELIASYGDRCNGSLMATHGFVRDWNEFQTAWVTIEEKADTFEGPEATALLDACESDEESDEYDVGPLLHHLQSVNEARAKEGKPPIRQPSMADAREEANAIAHDPSLPAVNPLTGVVSWKVSLSADGRTPSSLLRAFRVIHLAKLMKKFGADSQIKHLTPQKQLPIRMERVILKQVSKLLKAHLKHGAIEKDKAQLEALQKDIKEGKGKDRQAATIKSQLINIRLFENQIMELHRLEVKQTRQELEAKLKSGKVDEALQVDDPDPGLVETKEDVLALGMYDL